MKPGVMALFVFVWIIGAFLGSTFEFHSTEAEAGMAYSTGTATFTNGSRTVTGIGTTWVATMEDGLIKCNTDGEWMKIQTIVNNTELRLYAVYPFTGGAVQPYVMATSPGWAGTGSGGYDQNPVTTFEYLTNLSNAFQRLPLLGNIPLPVPNGEYFKTAYKVITWQWSFMEGYEMFYWIFCAPFVVMGVLFLLLLVYGILTGNITIG